MRQVLTIIFFASTILIGEMLGVYSPTEMNIDDMYFSVKHRFHGDLSENLFDTALGMDAGANVMLNYKFQFYKNLELKLSYTSFQKEKGVGVSYKFKEIYWLPIVFQTDIEYFRYRQESSDNKTRSNFIYMLSLTDKSIFKSLSTVINTGYDAYNQRFVSGIGVEYTFLKEVGTIEALSIIGEYYPVADRKSAGEKLKKYLGDDDCVNLGLKLSTYGHQFMLMISNSNYISARRLSLGTDEDAFWRLGFNLERKF